MHVLTDFDFPAATTVTVEKQRVHAAIKEQDIVAEEVAVALEYNGISHVVMMASPTNLADFALGFSLTEDILTSPNELFDCEIVMNADGIQAKMHIAAERFIALKAKRRNLIGRTGCGLCGAETLAQAIRKPLPVKSSVLLDATSVYAAIISMQQQQSLQQQTGATHAAAWVQKNGEVLCVREDVGRHNALDKLIGALASAKHDFSNGAVIITSRASYEMVQKAASMGIGFIAAISAPTALAIALAQQVNVTLLGFVRAQSQSHVVYAHGQRLINA